MAHGSVRGVRGTHSTITMPMDRCTDPGRLGARGADAWSPGSRYPIEIIPDRDTPMTRSLASLLLGAFFHSCPALAANTPVVATFGLA